MRPSRPGRPSDSGMLTRGISCTSRHAVPAAPPKGSASHAGLLERPGRRAPPASPASTTLTAFALGVPAGILGAHVLDMMEYWSQHGGLRDVLSPTGSSIYGAFLVVFPLIWLYARSQRASPLRFLDGGAPAMAL